MKWECTICEHVERSNAKPELCARCGALNCFLPLQSAPSSFQRAADIKPKPVQRLPTGDNELDALLGGGFPPSTRVLVWGVGGSGKSRCALRWATKLAGRGHAIAVSLEMDEELCTRTAREAGGKISRLLITRDEAPTLPTRGVQALVYDSISEAQEPEAACKMLSAWAKSSGGIVLLVCHATKDGQYRGPSTLQHWGEVEMQVSAARNQPGSAHLQIKKSRVSPLGVATVPLVGLHAV